MLQESRESVQHCLCMMKSPPVDLLWGLSWTQGWAWGLNLWPMARAAWWPPAWGRIRGAGLSKVSSCRKLQFCFLSFTQWCKSPKSLDFVAVPQSLSVRSMVSQRHLEQDENLVLLCAAVWGNSGTPREWGSKSSSWDEGVCNLPTQAPSSAARSAWVCLVTWRGWSVFSLADFVASILSVMSCMADLVTCLPWKYEWFEMWKCRDWASAEGLALLITLLRPGW